MYLNYTNCIDIYKNGYIYGILPFAIIFTIYGSIITHTLPIYVEFRNFNPYITIKYNTIAFIFVFISVAGLAWPITLPIALISFITY